MLATEYVLTLAREAKQPHLLFALPAKAFIHLLIILLDSMIFLLKYSYLHWFLWLSLDCLCLIHDNILFALLGNIQYLIGLTDCVSRLDVSWLRSNQVLTWVHLNWWLVGRLICWRVFLFLALLVAFGTEEVSVERTIESLAVGAEYSHILVVLRFHDVHWEVWNICYKLYYSLLVE